MSYLQLPRETIEAITAETAKLFEQGLAKDATTTGYQTGTGLIGYDLSGPAKQLVPFMSGLRQRFGRVKAPIGSLRAHWKAITKINANNQSPTMAFGSAANTIATTEQDFSAAYHPIGFGDTVMWDAEVMAQGFDNVRARSTANTLLKLMEAEDILLLGGQSFGLNTPVLNALSVSTTLGHISAASVDVICACRTLEGYYYLNGSTNFQTPGSTIATASGMTGSTNQITATLAAAIPGAVVYDWYVGVHGGTMYYYTSTTITTVSITSVPIQAATPNFAITPLMVAPPATLVAGGTDTSGDPNSIDGLLASITGNFTTDSTGTLCKNGTGNPTGATFVDNHGGVLTGNNGTVNEIDALLFALWWNARINPSLITLNSIDHYNLSNKIINSGGAYTLFRPDQLSERQKAIGGAFVATYINKAVNGAPIPLMSHPWAVQGTIAAITETVPYPNSEINNVFEVETQEEYNLKEYPAPRLANQTNGGPRYDYDERAIEAFKNYAPVVCGCLSNVANG